MSKPKTGRLLVTIHEVRKLFNTQSMGAQDPFAKLECGDTKYKTKIVKDAGSMCAFEQQFLFDLKGGEVMVIVELWAEKALGDDFIGKAVIPIVQFYAKKVEPTWTRLGRNTKDNVSIAAGAAAAAASAANPFAGEVLISSEFTDDDKSADAKEAATTAAIAQLQAQCAYFQAALGQKCRDADAEAKAYDLKLAEANTRNAELKETVAKMEAIIAGLRAAASASAVVAADAKSQAGGKAEQVAALEKQIEALRPAPVEEEYFENQRYAPIVGWKVPYMPYDPKPFTNGQYQERTRNQIALPQGWAWSTEWTIDCTSHPVEHVNGWEYAMEFGNTLGHTAWHPKNTASDTVRRRRWVRSRVVQLFAGAGAKVDAAVAAAAAAAGALPAAK